MQKLIPSLWYNINVAEASELYLSAFINTKIVDQQNYPTEGLLDFPKGFADEPLVIDMEIEGFRISLTNADDTFRPNPSISFMLNFDPMMMDDPRAEFECVWMFSRKAERFSCLWTATISPNTLAGVQTSTA